MCTADEEEGFKQISKNIRKIKIGSAELNDYYFLRKVAKKIKLHFFRLVYPI